MRVSDYILMPSDIAKIGRGLQNLGRRDLFGIVILAAVFVGFKLLLNQDAEDSLFVAVLFGSLWWRVDPRIPLVGAIGVLIIIPLSELIPFVGDAWSEPLAVIAYYLLVIGVLGQVRELRAGGGEGSEEEVVEKKEPPKPKKREPVRTVKMRDMDTIAKLRANREALRRKDW